MDKSDIRKYIDGMPGILYKYRDFSDNSLRILENQELYFSSPLRFNDPFDSCVPLTLANLDEIVLKTLKQENTLASDSSREDLLQGNKAAWDEYRKKFETLYHIEHQQSREKKFGICSLTESYSNLLMWSHYADSHRGFCIGFDIQCILNSAYPQIRLNCGTLDVIWCFKVQYNPSYPLLEYRIVNPEIDNRVPEEKVLEAFQPLLNKSNEWSYEHEWRLVSNDANNFAFLYVPKDLKVIYLGCAISEDNREYIKRIVKQKYQSTKIYQAKMIPGTWKLGYDLVN